MSIFGTSDHLIPLILDGLSDEDSRRRSRGPEGPSIAWHLGHLLHCRHQAMKLLGGGTENPYADRFFSTGASDGADYPGVAELRQEWHAVSERFMAALGGASDELLSAPVAGGAHAEECVRDKIAFVAFHEGYHLGSIAAIQKQLGYATPPEKIMAAMAGGG